MKCTNTRRIVYLSEYPEIVAQEMVEAKRHVKECPECRGFLEGERAFGSMVKNTIRKETAPEELKRRVFNIKIQKKRHLKGIYRMLAIAASVLILVIAGYIFQSHTDRATIIGKIVEDHIKFLPLPETQISSSDPDEIQIWFKGRADFPVKAALIKAKLKGGRLCLFDERHAALLFYEHNNTPVSLFIIDGVDRNNLRAMKEVMLENRKVYVKEIKGYTIALWEDRGLSYVLVSELSFEEIKRLI